MAFSTVSEYLASLPADRRTAIDKIRKAIHRKLPAGYQEGIQFGMISWFVPLSTYPAGYGGNRKVPLPLLSLASQKNYMALYMLCFYAQPALSQWFVAEYQKSGKKLDMGKGCVRFETLDHLALDVVERIVSRIPVADHVASYQAVRDAMGKGKTRSKPKAAARTTKTATRTTKPATRTTKPATRTTKPTPATKRRKK